MVSGSGSGNTPLLQDFIVKKLTCSMHIIFANFYKDSKVEFALTLPKYEPFGATPDLRGGALCQPH